MESEWRWLAATTFGSGFGFIGTGTIIRLASPVLTPGFEGYWIVGDGERNGWGFIPPAQVTGDLPFNVLGGPPFPVGTPWPHGWSVVPDHP